MGKCTALEGVLLCFACGLVGRAAHEKDPPRLEVFFLGVLGGYRFDDFDNGCNKTHQRIPKSRLSLTQRVRSGSHVKGMFNIDSYTRLDPDGGELSRKCSALAPGFAIMVLGIYIGPW